MQFACAGFAGKVASRLSSPHSHECHVHAAEILTSILLRYRDAHNILFASVYTADVVNPLLAGVSQKGLERVCLGVLTEQVSALLPSLKAKPATDDANKDDNMGFGEGRREFPTLGRPSHAHEDDQAGAAEPVEVPSDAFYRLLAVKLFGIFDMLSIEPRAGITNSAGVLEPPLGPVR